MIKSLNIYTYVIALFLFGPDKDMQGQDIIHLNEGIKVECTITEISDFILYAKVSNDPYLLTFFADDVTHLDIDPKNTKVIRQLKKGIRDAMKYSNPLEDNTLYGFYFGMPYDSVEIYTDPNILYKTDSLGNPILVPYNPLDTKFSSRLKSLAKSLGENSLIRIIGLL